MQKNERLRPGVPEFAQSITTPEVADAFAKHLPTSAASTNYSDELLRNVQLNLVRRKTPAFLALDPYIAHITAMKGANVWESLLSTRPHELQSGVGEFFHFPEGEQTLGEVSETLSSVNDKFMTPVVVGAGLVAVFGSDAHLYMTRIPEAGSRDGSWRYKFKGRLNLIRELGDKFPEHAESVDEIYARLQRMFPTVTVTADKDSLLELGLKHKIFDSEHGDAPVVCPAIGLTRILFQEYGKLLREPEYEKRFKQDITSTNAVKSLVHAEI